MSAPCASEALQTERDHRLNGDKNPDNRSKAQRDRDRILYSTAFRRLGAVTQVVLARDDGHLFHNRLTHSLKVAQVGRRLAEKLVETCASDAATRKAVEARGGLDPDVVEAACLAHDLGHPPFGHLAEKELHRLAQVEGVDDGFEGNAQTFRIVTRLALTKPGVDGLNLTVATLNAIAKYPWAHADREPGDKWGAYNSELMTMRAARNRLSRAGINLTARQRTIEAEVMDWADDIAYAVHDLEDFFRAGFIPLYRLRDEPDDVELTEQRARRDWWSETAGPIPSNVQWQEAEKLIIDLVPFDRAFGGTAQERARLRFYSSGLVHRLVKDTTLDQDGLKRTPEALAAVGLLKALTARYVHESPALATQQHGERRVVADLFRIYLDALNPADPAPELFPSRLTDDARTLVEKQASIAQRVRFVCDSVSSMTEARTFAVHHRLMGIDVGELVMSPA